MKKKIAFLCLQEANEFLTDITREIEDEYEVIRSYTTSMEETKKAVEKADIVWIEWLDDMAIRLSNSDLLKGKKTIIRLHRYEAFRSAPTKVNWNNIDTLILVSNFMLKILRYQIKNLSDLVKVRTVYNGVDLDKFKFKNRKRGFNLACVGQMDHRKNPAFLLQCMKALVDADPRYKLYVAGKIPSFDLYLYLSYMINKLNLSENIFFQGNQDDISTWLDDKEYIMSASIHESFGYGIAEGAARGLKPIIHEFFDVHELYPDEYIFSTVSDFVNLVINGEYNSEEYRKLIEQNYNLKDQIKDVKRILGE